MRGRKAPAISGRHRSSAGEGLIVPEWDFDPVLETLHYGIRITPKTPGELSPIWAWFETRLLEMRLNELRTSRQMI